MSHRFWLPGYATTERYGQGEPIGGVYPPHFNTVPEPAVLQIAGTPFGCPDGTVYEPISKLCIPAPKVYSAAPANGGCPPGTTPAGPLGCIPSKARHHLRRSAGVGNFVDDVPVQGPTDPGIRAADCWFVNNRIPAKTPCCGGTVKNAFSDWGLGGPGDPDIFGKLSPAQQGWVATTFAAIFAKADPKDIQPCGPLNSSAAMIRCFQMIYNAESTDMPVKPLRTDGVFDEDTLCALQLAATNTKFGVVPFPDPEKRFCQPPCPVGQARDPKTGLCAETTKPGLSTGAIVGIAAAGAVAVAGLVYAVSRK